ncbi:MAG: Stp1/IreP family PP2C-type Ser/Thr phosphatase [Proteobacteria bacterium]|nr:Stp1/IreP family PP2C-type Ser/Thr phosphatase [Pseudomonadota bacterium]
MSFHFKIGAMTDVGKVRAINEDNFTVEENLGLYVVADGLGGQNAGEVASKMAIETIKSYLNDEKNPLVGEYREEFSENSNRMLSGIRLINSAIYEAGQRNSEQRGMGTTISSVFINDNVMSLTHVGDSRIYRIRGGRLERLTVDHSVVEEQLKRGLITEDEAAESKYRNVITRALGAEETIEIDIDEEVLLDRDKILLCTDGLTNMVRDEEILQMILRNGDDPQKACEGLVDVANGRGGMDNITVILLYCEKNEQKAGLLERAFLSVSGGMRKASDAIVGLCKWKGGEAASISGGRKGEGSV